MTDKEMAERILAGDEQVFGRLYEREHKKVKRYVSRITTDQSVVNDITSEAFEKAKKQMFRYRGESKLFTWICAIAKHTMFEYLHKGRIYKESISYVANNDLRLDIDSPDLILESKELHKALIEAVKTLNHNEREVYELMITHQFSRVDAAIIMNKSIQSLSLYMQSAKRKVMDVIKPYLTNVNLQSNTWRGPRYAKAKCKLSTTFSGQLRDSL